ncbi:MULTISPECIES: DUF599 domain-containing protein [unclassified Thiocapsa]|uniref:DUF599 domain-containing protein n=1 Tax=unclassified Thiocapsa TaxID=2641286 RepID=UPI0035B2601D
MPLLWELVIASAALALLLGYHLWYALELKRRPLATSLGRNNRIRRLWLEQVIARGADILAVQTLRNWTMAATFLASTAIVLALGLMSVALTSDALTQLKYGLDPLASQHEHLTTLKALAIVLLLLGVFICFTLSLRYYNHAGFLINAPLDQDADVTIDTAFHAVSRGAGAYNLGMRGWYLALPLILWLLGPLWLLGSAVVMTAIVHRLDHEPG